MKVKLAKLISNIINPYTVSLAMVLLLCLKSCLEAPEALRWAAVALAFSVLPVLGIILWLVRRDRLEGIFIRAREQRSRIYLLVICCLAVSSGILYFSGAPAVLATKRMCTRSNEPEAKSEP